MSGIADIGKVRRITPWIDRPERDAFRLAFGRNLKSLRAAAGLSQSDLAARCFLRPDDISRLERGGAPPRLGQLLLLADALGVSVGQLTEHLVAPTRVAARQQMIELITELPGSGTGTLASASQLPEAYVYQLLRYMASITQIRRRGGGWQIDDGNHAKVR